MTFSIVARSEDGTELGVAVASKFLAVGAAVPAAEVGAGAIATQALANLAYRPKGLALLAAGGAAHDVLTTLLSEDGEHEHRQAGVVDARGGAASFTGAACHAWAGGTSGVTRGGSAYAVQGNILTGPDVVDLRVDDHPDPVPELVRLLGVRDLLFERPDPAACLPLEGEVADEVRRRLAALGHTGFDLTTALSSWAGGENLEERRVPGRIDPLVLDHLRALTSDGSTGGHA